MNNTIKVVNQSDAELASMALRQVISRLTAKGQDESATKLKSVADALEGADTIHVVAVGSGQA